MLSLLNKQYHYELPVISVIKNEMYTFNILVNLIYFLKQ